MKCNDVTGVTVDRTVQDYLTRAKLYDQVIRCTFSFETFEYRPYISDHFEGTIWVEYFEVRSSETIEGYHEVSETKVRNAVRMSRPGVELLHERDSAFEGDPDG